MNKENPDKAMIKSKCKSLFIFICSPTASLNGQIIWFMTSAIKLILMWVKKKRALPAGFEPTRGDPIGFQVQRLNHSATTAWRLCSHYKIWTKLTILEESTLHILITGVKIIIMLVKASCTIKSRENRLSKMLIFVLFLPCIIHALGSFWNVRTLRCLISFI